MLLIRQFMSTLDFVVMSVFAILMVHHWIGLYGSKQQKLQVIFEAGGQTPWWINGLSLFISYFSAATFVVWGSIAYRYGLVANAIQFTMCLSGFVTARSLPHAGKIQAQPQPPNTLGKRFGRAAKQYYSYMVLLYSLVSTAAVLYAVGKIVYVATPFSLEACITVIGLPSLLYTGGGLWGVLATDVVQFVILSAAVIIIIPLALSDVGGMTTFYRKRPPVSLNL
jgi:SSS family solute:Na+ symporter